MSKRPHVPSGVLIRTAKAAGQCIQNDQPYRHPGGGLYVMGGLDHLHHAVGIGREYRAVNAVERINRATVVQRFLPRYQG